LSTPCSGSPPTSTSSQTHRTSLFFLHLDLHRLHPRIVADHLRGVANSHELRQEHFDASRLYAMRRHASRHTRLSISPSSRGDKRPRCGRYGHRLTRVGDHLRRRGHRREQPAVVRQLEWTRTPDPQSSRLIANSVRRVEARGPKSVAAHNENGVLYWYRCRSASCIFVGPRGQGSSRAREGAT
jgi:hypothetical protein